MLGKFPVTVIPNGVDTAVFAPRSRRCARESLGIPEDARVVLFSAASVTSIRKGFAFLSSALEGLEIPALLLLSIGKGNPEVPKRIAHMHLGRISDERLLAAAYNAADVFAIPSLQDTLPNTVLEAMACGIPVVGFAVGGIKDQVESGLTGRLVPAGDAGALRDAITCLLHDGAARDQASRACRAAVLEKYELGTQVRRFVEVYQGMMEGGSVRASSAAAETLDGAEAPAAAFEIGR
jgi:glycosyltransferase involved in cell wall biosynthesis